MSAPGAHPRPLEPLPTPRPTPDVVLLDELVPRLTLLVFTGLDPPIWT